MIRVLDILHDTTVDGPGLRTSVYCAGCAHHCPGCHNPQSWPMDGGREMEEEELLRIILADPFADLTLTGGDPFFQAPALARLAQMVRSLSKKSIWAYTGFLFETLLEMPECRPLLERVDVLVDGPFLQHLRDESLHFRGSANQRLIRVPESLATGKVTLWQRESLV